MSEHPVVWISHKDGGRCPGCSAEVRSGDYITITREGGLRCLNCEGLAGLVFLGSGDPALTRRATQLSTRHAVVVKFSRARKRSERQGVLVEESALRQAEERCRQDMAEREAKAIRRQAKDVILERQYVDRFQARILELFPRCPPAEAAAIAKHACAKHSGRVGRSAWAKALEPKAIELAVQAHVRHSHTDYDEQLFENGDRRDARDLVRSRVRDVLDRWRGHAV